MRKGVKKEPKEPKMQKKKLAAPTHSTTSTEFTRSPCPPCPPTDNDNPIKHVIDNFKTNGISVLKGLNENTLNQMIIESNAAYYNENLNSSVLMTDNEYDILKEFIAKKYPKNMVIQEVGAPVEKNKAVLPYQMPSMDKIKPDTGALKSWKNKYKGDYVLSCKLDGVSGMYTTEGDVPKLYTRGNGKIGQDVSHLITYLKLPTQKGIVVRGEFIIPRAVFESKYMTKFANARNLVAGIVNRQTMDEKIRDLHFVAYEVIQFSFNSFDMRRTSPEFIRSPPLPSVIRFAPTNGDGSLHQKQLKPSAQMAELQSMHFETVQNLTLPDITNEGLSDILVDWRKNYAYEIDGVIVANDDIYSRESGNPDHSFAFKMVLSDQMAEVKVLDVLWSPSKDGYLKPRVQFEPVNLSGVKIEYATGFNAAFIETNKIGVGALIQIIRSGDVIPHIRAVITPAEQPKMPVDAYRWNDTHVDIIMEDSENNLTVKEKNITGFFRGIEVDGLKSGNVSRIINAGFDTIPMIIHLTKDDLLTIDGFKEKTATKLYHGIREKLKSASILTLMSASNIFGRGFGDIKIELVLNAYPHILTSTEPEADKIKMIANIEGMAAKTAEAFVSKIPVFLGFLAECGLQNKIPTGSVPVKPDIDTNHPLYKKTVVMSGTRDKSATAALSSVGAKLGAAVSKNTYAVITDDKESDTGKVADAKSLNIPLFTPSEFMVKYF